jgi:hypothetical protein
MTSPDDRKPPCPVCDSCADLGYCAARQAAESRCEALTTALREWEECALYDPLLSGPRFKGWDRSALDRCRRKAEDARAALAASGAETCRRLAPSD